MQCAAALPDEAKFCPHCGRQQDLGPFMDDEPTNPNYEPLFAMLPPPPTSQRGEERIAPKRSDTFERPDVSHETKEKIRSRRIVR